MKLIGLLAGAVLALCSVAPASGDATSVNGIVRLPAGVPNLQRMGHITKTLPNGAFGYVLRLGPGATNSTYTLTLREGATKVENLDVYFYYALDGFGDPCPIARDVVQSGNTETGTVCPTSGPKKAGYAIVVLNSGAMGKFSLTI